LNQISIEDPELKHGVFTYFLLEGLKGKADDKVITPNNLYDFTAAKVQSFVSDKYQAFQIPQYRANFSGIFELNKISPEAPVTEDLESSELFSEIYLARDWQKMGLQKYNALGIEREIKSVMDEEIKEILLVLRKEYGVLGFDDDGEAINFKDGFILRESSEDEDNDLISFRIGVHFDHKKERQKAIDTLMLSLDDYDNSWVNLRLTTESKFDYSAVEKLCDEKGYEIVDLKIKPMRLTFSTKFFSDKEHSVALVELANGTNIYIRHGGYLEPHFYTLVNPRKVCELLSSTVKK